MKPSNDNRDKRLVESDQRIIEADAKVGANVQAAVTYWLDEMLATGARPGVIFAATLAAVTAFAARHHGAIAEEAVFKRLGETIAGTDLGRPT